MSWMLISVKLYSVGIICPSITIRIGAKLLRPKPSWPFESILEPGTLTINASTSVFTVSSSSAEIIWSALPGPFKLEE
ncbi:hypothetical protein FQZ97_776850 [compost metagenome]